MNTNRIDDDRLEKELQHLFDSTAQAPDRMIVNRLLVKCEEIPARGRGVSFLRRAFSGFFQHSSLRIMVPAAAIGLAVFLGVVRWHPDTIFPADQGTSIVALHVEKPTPHSAGSGKARLDDSTTALELTDPLAGLDSDWDAEDDALALLDPPHMVFDDVDASTWSKIYGQMLNEKDSKSF